MENVAFEQDQNADGTGSRSGHDDGNGIDRSTNTDVSTSSSDPLGSEANENGDPLWQNLIPTRGMLMTLLSSIIYSFVDISIAIASEELNTHLLVSLYSAVIVLLAVISILATKKSPPSSKNQYVYLLIGCGFFAAGLTFLCLAISKMPVGDAISVLHCMPIFTGVLGWIFLKQPLRALDVLFCILCIAGVAIISRPSFIFQDETISKQYGQTEIAGVLFATSSAFSFSVSFITGRKLQESLSVHLYYIILFNACLTFVINAGLCSVLQLWSTPSTYYLVFAFIPGLLGYFAQLSVFFALKLERAVTVTIISTAEIAFTYVLQILIVKIIPHWYSAIGALCILVSCIGIVTRK